MGKQVGKIVLYKNAFNKMEYFQLATIYKQNDRLVVSDIQIPGDGCGYEVNNDLVVDTIENIESKIVHMHLLQLEGYARFFCNEIGILVGG